MKKSLPEASKLAGFFIRIQDFGNFPVLRVLGYDNKKELRLIKSNKQAQRVFNKIYTNESTNRERIRFYQPGYQILLSSLLLIGTEVIALVKER